MKKASDLRIPFTWEERRPVVLDRFFYIPGHFAHVKAPLSWEEVFPRSAPIVVEYCSGNGQWICEKAKEHPEKNWVAVEKRFDRARKIWLGVHRENLSNLFVVCGEALQFTRFYLPEASIEAIYINFPDPWPKRRAAKHRLIQKEFLEEIQGRFDKRGVATFVTDDAPYRDQILEEIGQCSDWHPLLPPPYFSAIEEGYGDSFFKELWEKKGRGIYSIQCEVTP